MKLDSIFSAFLSLPLLIGAVNPVTANEIFPDLVSQYPGPQIPTNCPDGHIPVPGGCVPESKDEPNPSPSPSPTTTAKIDNGNPPSKDVCRVVNCTWAANAKGEDEYRGSGR
jgi:hypothetical protein